MSKVYYGWWVVLAAFWILFVCAGIGFHSFPIFLKYIETNMNWGRDSLSLAGAIAALAAGFATPAVGYAVDRYGARVVMMPGVMLLSASFLLLSRVNSLPQLYVLFLVVGIGMTSTTVLPINTLVSRWFDRERGRAMGIVSVGGGVGGMIWMPVMTFLIEKTGWRNTYWVLGIIILVISLPLIWFVIRKSPQSMGLSLDGRSGLTRDAGDHDTVAPPASITEEGYTLRQAVGTASFWLIFCGTFLGVFAGSGFGLHVIAFLSDSGLSAGKASLVWSATIGVSIVGMFSFGLFSEKRQKRYLVSGANVFRALSILLLALFAYKMIPKAAAIIQLTMIYGLALGCNVVTGPLLLSETFGVKAFGKISGLIGIPFTIGMALGQVVGGRLFELRGDYRLAFCIFALALLSAGVTITFAKPYHLFERQKEGVQDHKTGTSGSP